MCIRDRVTTICYGQKKEWDDRWEAVDFFKEGAMAVSYTHLDVYKRQGYRSPFE